MPRSFRNSGKLTAMTLDGSCLPNLAPLLTQAVVSVAKTNPIDNHVCDALKFKLGCRP